MHDEFQQLVLEKRSRLLKLGFTIPEVVGLSTPQLDAVLRLVDEFERKIEHERKMRLAEFPARNNDLLIFALEAAMRESLNTKTVFLKRTARFVSASCWTLSSILGFYLILNYPYLLNN